MVVEEWISSVVWEERSQNAHAKVVWDVFKWECQ